MWTCPKCGRTFARTNQSHWCGEKPLSVDEYLAQQPEDVRPELEQMRNNLGNALPDAEERIAWSMPTYWQGRNLIHFAAAKHHIGLYPGDAAVRHFKDELGRYVSSKGSIQIPYGAIDADLVTRIALWSLEEERQAGPEEKA